MQIHKIIFSAAAIEIRSNYEHNNYHEHEFQHAFFSQQRWFERTHYVSSRYYSDKVIAHVLAYQADVRF